MPRGGPSTSRRHDASRHDDEEMDYTMSQATQQTQSLTQAQRVAESLPKEVIAQKVSDLVQYMLITEAKKNPVKRADLYKHVLKEHKTILPEVLRRAKVKLDEIFGYELVEVEHSTGKTKTKCYFLLNTLSSDLTEDLVRNNDETKFGLLYIILALIFMNEGSMSDGQMWLLLHKLGLNQDEKDHPVYGDVKKLITQDFTKQLTTMEDILNHKTGAPVNDVTIKVPDFSQQNGHHRPSERPALVPEYWKTLWSYAYMNLVIFIMCYATVVTHREAPDRKVHPPLPDRLFDNLPRIEWGTMGSEVCIIIQGIACVVLCIFHKHRTIVFRRFCIILTTVYMMRIITMLSTALPVLPPPSECTNELTDTVYERLALAVSMWMKSGSRLYGMKMCGDYMFSGHITSLTVGNLTFLEYTPAKLYVLRYVSITINIVGSYILIVGKGHYTVDVVVAIFLVFVVFHYYHSLANIYVLTKSSEKLRWFPFFWYFERNVCRAVPNEYEIPRLSKFVGEHQ